MAALGLIYNVLKYVNQYHSMYFTTGLKFLTPKMDPYLHIQFIKGYNKYTFI